MNASKKNRISHSIAKAFVCGSVILLTISGVTLLSIAAVVVWFYGEDLLSDLLSGHFDLVQKLLPNLCK